MVIRLLGVKTRFADKSAAEHYYYYYFGTMQEMNRIFRNEEKKCMPRSCHFSIDFKVLRVKRRE